MRFSAEKLDCPLEQQLARRIEAGALAQACLDGQLRPPSRVSVIELAQVCVRGQQAWQRFLLANQGLVWQAVRGLGSGHGLDRDELFQEGFAVLADTLRRYDHRLGRFSSYAFPRLRNELAALAATRMGQLGLPVYLSKLRRQALGYAGGGGGPTTAIADEFPADKAKLWRKAASFSPPAALAEDSLEAPPADTGLEEADLVDRALRKLPGSYREVLSARYLDNPPRTYEELGRSLGLSPSSVRRMEARGLDSLRALLRSWDAA